RARMPSNFLLDAQGNAWVTDFGLAKLVTGRDDLTRTGQIVGTLAPALTQAAGGRTSGHGPFAWAVGRSSAFEAEELNLPVVEAGDHDRDALGRDGEARDGCQSVLCDDSNGRGKASGNRPVHGR